MLSKVNAWKVAGIAFTVAMFAVPAISSAAVDTSVQSAFSGTGTDILGYVTGSLTDVLIPFSALLGISLIVKLYHKIRG